MTKNRANGMRRRSNRSKEAGQATLFFVLALGIFLLGALCFAIDMSNMWFHRQAAQTAADAACTAGAMDLLVDSQGGATGNQGFTAGTAYSCTTSSTDSVCKYAALNGYNSNATSPGNTVNVSFPSSVIGVTTPPSGIAPNPFIRVDVVDHVQTFFLGLFSGGVSKDVRAFATCGVEQATSPIPLVVLDPVNPNIKPAVPALNVQGTPTIAIVGGPSKSIQVDSSAATATNIGGAGTIDLSKGGPNGTGSNMGVYGGPAIAPSGFNGGTTGSWISPAAPISDPFAQLAAPAAGTAQAAPNVVAAGVDGCPDTNCYEYLPGSYAGGICVGKPCTYKTYTTAIFQGGVYLVNGFTADSNSCLRMSTVDAQGIGGVMFYFTGGGTASVDSNSGSKCPSGTPFDTLNTATPPYAAPPYNGMLMYGVACTSKSTTPTNLPATLTGNVMLGPCTGTYGDPIGAADPLGVQRGILFFQDRSDKSANPSWGGGGSFLLAGTMYFHSCNSAGTGTSCGAAGTYYNDSFSLQGGSGSSTYVLGEIITDNLTLGGNSNITMDLNPTKAFTILKASLLQ